MNSNFPQNSPDSESKSIEAYGSDRNAPPSSVYVNSSGQFGIGTVTPASQLDVQGNTNINGGLTISNTKTGSFSLAPSANKIPVSDQNGRIDSGWLNGGLLPTGGMIHFAGAKPPEGFLLCDGSAVDRTIYANLFSVIGIIWGSGNGSTTFNLPNFQRRVAVGAGGTATPVLGNTVGSLGGAETHLLTTAEMPSHSHQMTVGGGSGNYISTLTYNSTAYMQVNTTPQGGNAAHNIMQASAVVNVIIRY